ncbi:hypothetical protein ACQHIH_16210 [Xanthomonas sontii]|uniref:hypothetical protein n=1 Tax=Xanthomonas sontii TaxID=2650745 RepID=UPI003F83F0BE
MVNNMTPTITPEALDKAVELALTAIRAEEARILGGYKTPDNGVRRQTIKAGILAALPELHAAPADDMHQHLLDMLGAKDHEDAGRIIGALHAADLAHKEYQEKTQWVQDTAKPRELGMHRADVLRMRLEQAAPAAAGVPDAQPFAWTWVSHGGERHITMSEQRARGLMEDGSYVVHGITAQMLGTHAPAAQPQAEQDRARETSRRQAAVAHMLADGWNWYGTQWLREPQAEQQGVADANSPWQLKAAEWLESQAETQEESNLKWPKHAQVYEAWRRRPEEYRHLALVLRLELRAALAARQPVGEPVAFVPVHPSIGPLWGDTYPAGSSGDGRPARYERRPLYTAPPATVDLSFLRSHCAGRIEEADRDRLAAGHGGDERGEALATAKRKAYEDVQALLDSKAVHHE